MKKLEYINSLSTRMNWTVITDEHQLVLISPVIHSKLAIRVSSNTSIVATEIINNIYDKFTLTGQSTIQLINIVDLLNSEPDQVLTDLDLSNLKKHLIEVAIGWGNDDFKRDIDYYINNRQFNRLPDNALIDGSSFGSSDMLLDCTFEHFFYDQKSIPENLKHINEIENLDRLLFADLEIDEEIRNAYHLNHKVYFNTNPVDRKYYEPEFILSIM